MGLFDFLFSGNSASTIEVVSDRIWISQHAKFNGVRKELEVRAVSGSVVVLSIAHFSDTLEQLNAIATEYQGDTHVMATLAEKLSSDIAAHLNLDQSARSICRWPNVIPC